MENAEDQIDDLKQQLDDALGAEDMVVQLTERTLHMGEVSLPVVFVNSRFPSDVAIPVLENGGNENRD